MKKITWFDIFLVLIGKRIKYRVEGNSMLPTLKDGDIVLIKPGGNYSVGNIVLANHPYKQSTKILKRITAISKEGLIEISGDNPSESSDSRIFGNIHDREIIGKMVKKLQNP